MYIIRTTSLMVKLRLNNMLSNIHAPSADAEAQIRIENSVGEPVDIIRNVKSKVDSKVLFISLLNYLYLSSLYYYACRLVVLVVHENQSEDEH